MREAEGGRRNGLSPVQSRRAWEGGEAAPPRVETLYEAGGTVADTENADGLSSPAATGPLVRPYTMTGGRTRPVDTGLDMISVIVALSSRAEPTELEPEHAAIVRLCQHPLSVAEVAAQLDIPITVVKVLIGDLIAKGEVRARAPIPTAELPEMNVLQAVLDGIRKL
ncbi:uncharacterized protein DUF742 [Haloactinospora alba]|uniref:Uncharacterized protein DUF742 n=1 Tax=Haloactinospora alba TaxID=405555 RepID=A0A543NHK5_9ACTN|nr:uncharacterized protein DUF742 [Haloactinospora alba]